MDESKFEKRELVKIVGLTKVFLIKQPIIDILIRKPRKMLRAVDNINLVIEKGEILGLVGESGCGKSTLAKTVMRLYNPDGGKVFFDGIDITQLKRKELRKERKKFQMIFQDPYSSLNPRLSVKDMLTEILKFHKICPTKEIDNRIVQLLEMVGMSRQDVDKFPGKFSGGQRQRLGIARALAVNPQFIIADEPVSSLDVSIQAQIINLIREIQQSLKLSVLFISHDLRVVRYITERTAVMYLGKIVEMASTEDIFSNPYHPYSQVLVKAAPALDPRIRTKDCVIEGEPSSPMNVSPGCRFYPRCSRAKELCKTQIPELKEVKTGRMVACHFPLL